MELTRNWASGSTDWQGQQTTPVLEPLRPLRCASENPTYANADDDEEEGED